MKLNELRAKRAQVIGQARAILDTADAETRHLTPDEIAQYNALIGDEKTGVKGEIAALDEQIAVYAKQEALEANLQEPAGKPPVKPEGGNKKTMKRGEFQNLSPRERKAFLKDGVLED